MYIVAVFNNDCMYVCHHLAMIGHQFNKSLPEDVQATFVDLMPKIRRLGTDTMLQQLNTQKDIMLDYLQAAKGRRKCIYTYIWFCIEKKLHQLLSCCTLEY